MCVFLEGFGAPFMIRKRDGGYLYATTDLAALRYRVGEMGARRIVYVTDARQKEHFRQLFAAARLAGYAGEDVRLDHAAFGSILGADGTPLKTREGRNVLLKDVIAEAVARARKVVAEKNPELPPGEQDAIARIVGVGALKYFDLRQNMTSDYVFDWDRMLALDGDTAPYLQYAYARVRSIFRKGGVRDAEYAGADPRVDARVEARLGLWLLRFGETVECAARECRPNIVAGYLYELAARFTAFYGECPVLKAEEPARAGRLRLCDMTARVLAAGLRLLGIEVSERM
jgi:arginyl-tRNA synthetase